MIGAPVLVELANAGRARRPPGAREPVREEPPEPALSAAVADIADSLIEGRTPSLDRLNRFAAECSGRAQVQVTPDGELMTVVEWDTAPARAVLARLVVKELGSIDPKRLRRCERPECDLIFYDSSRSGTQRWHSEVPCGWRARQQRRRATRGV